MLYCFNLTRVHEETGNATIYLFSICILTKFPSRADTKTVTFNKYICRICQITHEKQFVIPTIEIV